MALPNFTEDMNIIQALSDLPNSEDGLSAAELKQKFDTAGLLVKAFLNNQLIPAIAAKEIPFAETLTIPEQTVQAAIENVQEQVKEAASGTIPAGAVTKEKLSEQLLSRTYGGLAWLSMNTPGAQDNPDNDFPVGQVWIRPPFTVTNAAQAGWTGTGCSVGSGTNQFTVTGLGQIGTVTAEQTINNLGETGDRVKILLDVGDTDSEITAMQVSVNGEATTLSGGRTVMDTVLAAGGALTVRLTITWPSSSLATGAAVFKNYTVVNVDKTARQNTDAVELADWDSYLNEKVPFASCFESRAAFRQISSGQWAQVEYETLPVSAGGTGVTSLEPNMYLKTTGSGELDFLTAAEVSANLGALTVQTGAYTGTSTARVLTLPVTPKLLLIWPTDGPETTNTMGTFYAMDNPILLANGATKAEVWNLGTNNSFIPKVALAGNVLTFSVGLQQNSAGGPMLGNRSGIVYNWIALV